MNSWFRMYESVLDDPKVQRLLPEDFRAWINILCLACRNDGVLPAEVDIAFALRMTASKCSKTLRILENCGLLDRGECGLVPHNWNQRQYKSDVSTERVKRFRKRRETINETPPDTDTDTDTDTEKKKNKKRAHPRVEIPDGVNEKVWLDFKEHRRALRAPITDTAIAGIQREATKAGLSLNDSLRMCCERGWRGFRADWLPKDGLPYSQKTARNIERLTEWANGDEGQGNVGPDDGGNGRDVRQGNITIASGNVLSGSGQL